MLWLQQNDARQVFVLRISESEAFIMQECMEVLINSLNQKNSICGFGVFVNLTYTLCNFMYIIFMSIFCAVLKFQNFQIRSEGGGCMYEHRPTCRSTQNSISFPTHYLDLHFNAFPTILRSIVDHNNSLQIPHPSGFFGHFQGGGICTKSRTERRLRRAFLW